MSGLTLKDKASLAALYELPDFKAFKKLCAVKRQKVMQLLLQQDMSVPGADKRVSMLQGQAYALDMVVQEMQSIHRREIDRAVKEKAA